MTARDVAVAPSGSALTFSGNKTLAVEFGSAQDAALRQSLDLTVSGTLAPGVELTGVLSDRNTPLTAGGSTQDLQSLDRVLIELRAPHASAALGDVALNLQRGEFARLERRLQGASGEWSGAGVQVMAAAASAPGEYRRLQFFGVEGRQGPYQLTDRDGNTGVSVVAGSEVVTVDGVRMTRGESADYSMDYESARLTFSNRRPISAATRVTVDYQYTLNRFRRNFAAAGIGWERGPWHAFTQLLNEADDRGRPLEAVLDPADRLALQLAGDSLSRALGPGVSAGGGEYDTVRVAGGGLAYAWVGPDSGQFTVSFARIGPGRGDYTDSAAVAGRTAFRFVGAGNGAFRVGRALPMPESHQLWSLGGGAHAGPLAVEVEGAVSRRDLNTYSSLDDGNNTGQAGRASLSVAGQLRGALAGTAGVSLDGRTVGERFQPFARLERPFAEEDWGLPLDADLDHQRRVDLTGFWKPRAGGELRTHLGRLALPGGFHALARGLEWNRDGKITTHARWERSDSERPGLAFGDGGRERMRGELRWRLRWLEPMVSAESDERRFASDSGRVGDRFREVGGSLQSGGASAWRALAGYALRRDASAARTGFVDQSEARTLRAALESPTGGRLGASLNLQRRDLEPLASTRRTRSDLASLRLRADDEARGLSSLMNLEITSEGENRRARVLRFVGAGAGAYDALGNVVGHGDYDLTFDVSPDLERVARAAASARAAWQFGSGQAWRGSRLEFDFESEARRRGALRGTDALVSPGAVLGDGTLASGSVHQRFEVELAPGSPVGGLRLRAERRVNGDRSFENFGQTTDDRSGSARWQARPAAALTAEIEAHGRRQAASQALIGGGSYRRVLLEHGGSALAVYSPGAWLRAAGTLDASWSRPEGQVEFTRTLRAGPDLGLGLGRHGRAELSGRRAFVGGPAPVNLLPGVDPAGVARWEGSARLDYRLRESTSVGLSWLVSERPGQRAQSTGRAELKAFF